MKGLKLLNDYFDKIYVITLHRSVDRHEKINRQLADISFEYFYGVDKLNLSMDGVVKEKVYDPIRAKKMHRNNKTMNLGQVGCALSHRTLYQHILDKGYQKVLIMEDDLVPAVKDENVLRAIINESPKDWELIYWGYYLNEYTTPKLKMKQYYYYLLGMLRIIKWTPGQVSRLYPSHFSKHLRKAGFHNTTHAYAVSRPALQKLIDEQTPVAYNSDTLLSQLVLNGKLKAYITVPKIFEQEIFMEGGSKVSYLSD